MVELFSISSEGKWFGTALRGELGDTRTDLRVEFGDELVVVVFEGEIGADKGIVLRGEQGDRDIFRTEFGDKRAVVVLEGEFEGDRRTALRGELGERRLVFGSELAVKLEELCFDRTLLLSRCLSLAVSLLESLLLYLILRISFLGLLLDFDLLRLFRSVSSVDDSDDLWLSLSLECSDLDLWLLSLSLACFDVLISSKLSFDFPLFRLVLLDACDLPLEGFFDRVLFTPSSMMSRESPFADADANDDDGLSVRSRLIFLLERLSLELSRFLLSLFSGSLVVSILSRLLSTHLFGAVNVKSCSSSSWMDNARSSDFFNASPVELLLVIS